MNKKALIKELEDYKYENEYFLERYKNVQEFNSIISNLNNKANTLDCNNEANVRIFNANIEKLLQEQRKEELELLEIIRKKNAIEQRIDKLRQPYKNVLLYRYVSLYSFGEIAKKMNYSTKRIYQLHQEGIDLYKKIHDDIE